MDLTVEKRGSEWLCVRPDTNAEHSGRVVVWGRYKTKAQAEKAVKDARANVGVTGESHPVSS